MLSARKSKLMLTRWLVALIAAGSLFAACGNTDVAESDLLTGDSAVVALQQIFDDYAVNDELCQEQINALAADIFADLDTTGNLIADDPPYADFDTTGDGFITEDEFKAGQFAEAEANVDTNNSGCVTFDELKEFQAL